MAEEPLSHYKGNSHKKRAAEAKPEKVKPEQVTVGKVTQRKKPLGRRFVENFTGDDMHGVVGYVALEVLLPAAKNMISDAVSQGINRLLFGDGRPAGGLKTSYTNYRGYSGSPVVKSDPGRQMSRQGRATHNFDEIILETRGEADAAIEKLQLMIDHYDVATVSDLYDIVGITGEFTDNKWGWTDLRGATARLTRQGYLLVLPKPIDLP